MSDRANVEEWFQKFHTFIEDEENDINLDNIWNIDETGFQIGYLKNGIFLWTFGEIDHPVLTDAHETISVTVVESISAKGRVIPPFIIMPGTQIPSRWVDNRLDENATIVTTPKGYIDQAGDPFHVHRPRIHGVEMDEHNGHGVVDISRHGAAFKRLYATAFLQLHFVPRRMAGSPIISSMVLEPPDQEDKKNSWDLFPWKDFPGYTQSQRCASTSSWIWQFGYDIEKSDDDTKRRWVCKVCVDSRRPNPHSAASSGTQNAEIHLWNDHKVCDPSGRRKPPSKAKEKTPSRNIAEMMKLNTRDAREQQIANQIIGRFDRLDFQRLVVSWIINSNSSFRQS
ncbi:hypothetical protein BFJ71_g17471, partial [Fusarium oxysporum]